MSTFATNILKQIPSLRLLISLVIGILLQYHLSISSTALLVCFCVLIVLLLLQYTPLLSFKSKFIYSFIKGILLLAIYAVVGGLLAFAKNDKNTDAWLGNYFTGKEPVVVTLQENIVAKEKSYKALTSVEGVYLNNKWQNASSNVLLYFKKDSTIPELQYGSQIIVHKNLNSIINSGNPGGFNYAEYCSFQHIHFQGFLRDEDYTILKTSNKNSFDLFLLNLRNNILTILRQNIKDKDELSIAQALLIGYRDELDRDLVRAYSNTGVVHIIAISGLHLGMIYALLILLFKPINKYKWTRFAKPVVVIIVLWLFSLIAGMAPSILRSAIMFTTIAIGDAINKRSNIYNSLSISAIIILLINPFSLWDVGFQLSYTAVLSIILFSPYIKNWFYFRNKILQAFWNLNAITLSAQILTLPVVLYHFHQFPTLFLVTNILAVPWSGLILYGELLLIVFSFLKPFAIILGNSIGWMIGVMNNYIVKVNMLPFSVIENLQITIPQAICVFIFVVSISYWLIQKNKKLLLTGLAAAIIFCGIRTVDFINRYQQQKLIVYNVPSHTAIDVVEGREYYFIGDSIMNEEGFLKNFHIKPSRILHRTEATQQLQNISYQNNYIYSNNKIVAIVDKPLQKTTNQKIPVDVVVITKNPKLYINDLLRVYDCKTIVFDGSNSNYKINYWKKDCDSIKIKYHDCAQNGAFVMNL